MVSSHNEFLKSSLKNVEEELSYAYFKSDCLVHNKNGV